MRKFQPILDKIGTAAIVTRDATRYWFSRLARLWVFLLVLSALVSALAFFFLPFPRTRYYLEFPDARTGKLRGELRYAPYHLNREKAAETLCQEILIGPQSLRSRPLFGRDTAIRSCLLRGGVLFLDLSPDMVLEEPPEGSYRDSLALMAKLIKKNSIGLRKVVLTVGGNETYADNSEEGGSKKASPAGKGGAKSAGTGP